jgi:hypothetical protein
MRVRNKQTRRAGGGACRRGVALAAAYMAPWRMRALSYLTVARSPPRNGVNAYRSGGIRRHGVSNISAPTGKTA